MKTGFSYCLIGLLTVGFSLGFLEWAYQHQLLDMYKPELHSFNAEQEILPHSRKPTLLVMGDSFSVGGTSYTGLLQESLQNWRVVNSAVSGTGVIETLVMAPKRFEQFRPSLFLYQVYVGNDLLNMRYPLNWTEIPLVRNAYWLVANYFRVIGYLNYRMGQIVTHWWTSRTSMEMQQNSLDSSSPTEVFSPDLYDGKTKIYFRAEPSFLEDSILVQGERQKDYAIFLKAMEQLLDHCKAGACEAYVLVIPHMSQIDAAHLSHVSKLGARVSQPQSMMELEYPFIRQLRERTKRLPNVHILNPIALLKEATLKRPVYYANDGHLNLFGQKVIADYLVQQLNLN